MLPLGAQQYEPTSLGVQVRMSIPEASLRDALEGFKKPGLGLSLVMEEDFLDGYRARLDLGLDSWTKGNLFQFSGAKGGVSAFHLAVEGVRMLRPDADPPLLGPYVLAGLGLYAWNLSRIDTIPGASGSRRVNHVAFTVGFGWRLTPRLDVELKGLMGIMEPKQTAAAGILGATYRF